MLSFSIFDIGAAEGAIIVGARGVAGGATNEGAAVNVEISGSFFGVAATGLKFAGGCLIIEFGVSNFFIEVDGVDNPVRLANGLDEGSFGAVREPKLLNGFFAEDSVVVSKEVLEGIIITKEDNQSQTIG